MNKKPTIIYMADEKITCGGFCDKITRILYLYKIANNLNSNFKIHFTHPFLLSDYLLPNNYNWKINKNNIILDKNKTIAVISFSNPDIKLRHYDKIKFDEIKCIYIEPNYFIPTLNRLIQTGYNQILCYYNLVSVNIGSIKQKYFKEFFSTFFKLSPKVQRTINCNLNEIDGRFISAHFRFQKLLGDFRDHHYAFNFRVMNRNEKALLINKCIESLYKISTENNGLKILVCSDSSTFLNEASKLDFVHVVDGYDDNIKHISADSKVFDDKAVIKLLTDLLLMSHSERIYSVNNVEMYKGQFAKMSALLGDKRLIYMDV